MWHWYANDGSVSAIMIRNLDVGRSAPTHQEYKGQTLLSLTFSEISRSPSDYGTVSIKLVCE